jgi:sporadic carbohydrate cluster 2OG-Fe(II) oxygenase|tara:strand:- start:275 stop:1015 length:741 start_codon:yes stop_codon:yes gene_type:complete
MKKKYTLIKDGFEKRKLNKIEIINLISIKKNIELYLVKKLKVKNLKLENLHKIQINKNFNDLRLEIISQMNKIPNLQEKLFNIFKPNLIELFGKDIAGQKNINLAIQRPYDKDRAPMHSDAPSNSLYEVVIWLPLVDCKKTMNMFFFPLNQTQKTKNFLLNEKTEDPEKFATKNGFLPKKVNFGEFIIFWTKVYHYVPVNSENQTRWSLNFRYKNLFSPYSQKGYLDYFEPVNYSEITNLALSNEK